MCHYCMLPILSYVVSKRPSRLREKSSKSLLSWHKRGMMEEGKDLGWNGPQKIEAARPLFSSALNEVRALYEFTHRLRGDLNLWHNTVSLRPCVLWPMTVNLWHMTVDIWHLTYDIYYCYYVTYVDWTSLDKSCQNEFNNFTTITKRYRTEKSFSLVVVVFKAKATRLHQLLFPLKL